MRPFSALAVAVMFLVACSSGENQQQNQPAETDEDDITLNQVWETGQNDLITPECATYHPERNVFYVSNLNRDNDAENDGYISIVNADGTIQNARWVEGLSSPLGNDFHDGSLYVNDNGQIVQIDIESGAISKRIPIERGFRPEWYRYWG
ncbi:MAG: hypothetical protein U5K69_10045 [Balneolaceae bacterium]|nr:hypothetical protein [Balneolaceae bacterium]